VPARLTIAADLAETARLAPWLVGLAEASAWPVKLAFAIELCLDEVVTNIALHGGVAAGAISIEIDQDAGSVTARVEDSGVAFDPTTGARAVPTSLDEAEIGGLGLVLVQHYASELRYERVEGHNRLMLRFALG
jgi:serine/threonine-protein kinase RsbW